MNYCSRIVFLVIATVFWPITGHSQSDAVSELDWQFGPTTSYIGDKAEIDVPDGYGFLGAEDTAKMMELMENIPNDNEYLLAPDDLSWFAVFEFNPVGYVEDNETLDPDTLLASVKKGTAQSNVERRNRGWGTMSITGWRFQPRFDQDTKLLEWALDAKMDDTNSEVVNYNTRLLGRTGVMEVVLVAEPETLDSAVAEFKEAITDFSFASGEKYAEYREGDRVAEFGLAALIVGGAAAVATKKGFWAVIAGFLAAAWKFLAVGVIALGAWVKSLFKSK